MTQRPPPAPGPAPLPFDHPVARLLAAPPGLLPPFDPAPLAVEYSPIEEAALGTALGCPDLCLIDAPGRDRGRLAADLAFEAVRAGRRVRVVAPGPTADAVVDRLVDAGEEVGRAVAPGEAVELLTRAAAGRTAAALADTAIATARRRAADAVAEAEVKLAGLNAEGIGERLARLEADEAAARGDHDRADVDAETCSEVVALRSKHAADREAACRAADAARAEKEARVARLRTELDEAVAAGKKRPGAVGFLVGLFVHEDPAAKIADLQKRLAAEEHAAARVVGRDQAAAALEPAHRAEQESLIRLEADRRRAGAAERLAALAAERGRLAELAGAVQAAQAEVRAARDRTVDPAGVTADALAQVRVAVGPAAATGADPLVPADAIFDQLIVADAEHLSDPEFDAVVLSAGRWVLVGDVSAPARPGRPAGPFARAWQRLHPRPFSYEGGRLIARLFDAPRAARLRAEPLADRPQIELRFARTPDGGVGVAEVAFPGNTALTVAKAFLASELGEVRLTVAGPVRWHDADDRLIACWPAFDGPRGGWADLGDGVRERIAGVGPDAPTAAVSFDKADGWDRESAAAWLGRHMDRSARTLTLPRPAAEPAAAVRVLAGVGG